MTAGERSVLIVGASGGIGAAVYARLAAEGLRVFGTFHTRGEKAAELERRWPGTKMLRCDVTSRDQVGSAVDEVVRCAGAIDALVLCPTPGLDPRVFEDADPDKMQKDMDTIYWGGVHAVRKVLPLMKARRSGLVLGFLSTVTVDAPPRLSSYTAAKCALLGLLRCVAAESRSQNIRVLGVSPYFVETDLIKAFPPKLLEMERQKQASGKFLTPDDLAELVLRIVLDQARGPEPKSDHWVIRNRTDLERCL